MADGHSTDALPPLPIVDGVRFAHIPQFLGYCAGTDGTIWSCRGRHNWTPWHKLTPFIIWRVTRKKYRAGYLWVGLRKNKRIVQKRVHILVLTAFRGPCPKGMEACHFPDRDTKNNRLDNLRWATHIENCQDREIHGNTTKGTRNGCAKLTEAQVLEIRKAARSGERYCDIARRFGISSGNVLAIATHFLWKHLSDGHPPHHGSGLKAT